MYFNDSLDYIPSARTIDNIDWFNSVARYVENGALISSKYKWQRSPTAYLCPSDVRPYSNYDKGGASYGMNAYLGVSYNPNPAKAGLRKISSIKKTSLLTLAVETDYMSVNNPKDDVTLYTLNPTSYSFGIIRYHNNSSNFLYADGHVKGDKQVKGYANDNARWCQW
jgi:prepilin-type processing-associated H-X9-DG protein